MTRTDMKHLSRYALCILAAVCACTAEPDAVTYEAPEVSFPMEEGTIFATVGDKVAFTASVVSGDKVTSSWYIDDVLVSSAQSFDYVFEAPGTYIVRFEARNGAGSRDRSYTVSVSDRLAISLSVGDSTTISRLQLDYLKVAAIVESGSSVTHQWTVNGTVAGTDAFFGSYRLDNAGAYTVSYHGENASGSFDRSFTVIAEERPLEVSFSLTDETIAILAGNTVNIAATPLFGATGLVQKWYLDDAVKAETGSFSHYFQAGEYTIRYEAENAKGETVGRTWLVSVTATGDLMDDFEAATIGGWFNTGENQPGIHLVENPDKSGINGSDQCLCDAVNGSGSTSGYFTLKGPSLKSLKDFDISKYSGLRFKIHLGNNKYYPRMDYGGTKYPSVTPPKFQNEWEVLEYKLPSGAKFDASKNIVFRIMYNEGGSNISGRDDATNNRTVYIDDIEFFE